MKDKLQSNILKTLLTAVFVTLSYLISEKIQVTTLILKFSDIKWHTTVSVAIYTAIFNAFFLLIISKRTMIGVEVTDRKDESDKISLSTKPRAIAVKIMAEGNLKKISGSIEIVFPKWVDITAKGSPDLKPDPEDTQHFFIELKDLMRESPEEGGTFFFDITIKPNYSFTKRTGTIQSVFEGNSFRYAKNLGSMSLNYKDLKE